MLRDRYQITEISSNHTGFGITYKVKDSNHSNQPIRILKQLKKLTASKLDIKKNGSNLTCTVDILKVFKSILNPF
ncbi:hypothetical protein OA07_24145 [Aphanizomenon flos-aquae 2012/KM1/D3]|uniref:hypothetical protein n=1 Tax=Aphanizomenon flos-aquae TaxID=1176 RepID=UPI000543726D|nr:hypothetical protein [Aphanizomenon flos-aquae]KHG39363.1 hypothetical protein OA07_24145 [Aphanizomenon flos-aquae 2012/KM1/D3]